MKNFLFYLLILLLCVIVAREKDNRIIVDSVKIIEPKNK